MLFEERTASRISTVSRSNHNENLKKYENSQRKLLETISLPFSAGEMERAIALLRTTRNWNFLFRVCKPSIRYQDPEAYRAVLLLSWMALRILNLRTSKVSLAKTKITSQVNTRWSRN